MVTDRPASSQFSSSIALFGSIRRRKVKPPPPPLPPSPAAFAPNTANAARPKRDWNDRGWIRIFCGPHRDCCALDETSRMVNVPAKANAAEVAADLLDLPAEYALWVQTGGAADQCRRLRRAEHPLLVQEEFCTRLGWTDAARRARLAIDPQLKHLLRFFVGPAVPQLLMMGAAGGAAEVRRSGSVELLKGLVSPQWRRRAVAIVGSWLVVYAGNTLTAPDVLDLAHCEIIEHAPGYNRLILKIVPLSASATDSASPAGNGIENACKTRQEDYDVGDDDGDDGDFSADNVDRIGGGGSSSSGGANSLVYSSSTCSLSGAGSIGGGGGGCSDRERVLFFGFEESWERDLWSAWLIDISTGYPAMSTFGCKTRVTFNPADLIDLDSLEYPPDIGDRDNANDADEEEEEEQENDDDSVVARAQFDDEYSCQSQLGIPPQASTHSTLQITNSGGDESSRCIDIAGSGLHAIPDVVLHSMQSADELRAGQNQLQAIGLRTIAELSALRVLRLPGNGFAEFPEALLRMQAPLRVLDVAENGMAALPAEIWRLESLEELLVERNALQALPETLRRLKHLRTLNAAYNRIGQLPEFLLAGGGGAGGAGAAGRRTAMANGQMVSDEGQQHMNPPLTKVNLRSNQLRGSIILGNYGYLTQLDVSDNDIEILDLSALDQLETLQCAHNKIKEIMLNGRVLSSLVAGNNDLCKISVSPPPALLTHLDLSHNQFTALPDWIPHCDRLHTLFASHNQITVLPASLFTNPNTQLHSIHLAYNRIAQLPAMPRPLPLHELHLHNNRLTALPDDFFSACCPHLIVLNLSSNQLQSLPPVPHPTSRLQRIYLTSNALDDNVYAALSALHDLRTLHAAYNRLHRLPEQCASIWPHLQELILSGNNLLYLPDSLATLPQLRTLRVHSNQLQTAPALAQCATLRTLDLAHNQLDRVNLVALVPRRLRFLDLSCNQRLQVDPRQLQLCRAQRPMSLVDVSGRNRASLPAIAAPNSAATAAVPTQGVAHQEAADFSPPWRLGFSETAGSASPGGRLWVSQLRLPSFCNTEGLFGLFDGEASRMQPAELVTVIPKLLLEERTQKETAAAYMRYTLLAAHRELRVQGQQQGACALLCHVSLVPQGVESGGSSAASACRYVLRVASVGQAQAILIRRHGHVALTPSPRSAPATAAASAPPRRSLGHSAAYPHSLPDPEQCEVTLTAEDEYLVLGNRRLWDALSAEAIVREIRTERNVILAAKRLQDIALGYGAAENLSLIIVQFGDLAANAADLMMRELRSRIGQPKAAEGTPPHVVSAGFCRCGCCCEANNNCCHSGAAQQQQALQFQRQSSQRSSDDRSSPSGQSDVTDMSVAVATSAQQQQQFQQQRRSAAAMAHERRSLRNCAGIVRAVRARIEEEVAGETGSVNGGGGGAESDSALSEEQFKCWEYMLEQNTQLLFDKELNTISKALTAQQQQKKKAGSASNMPLKSLSLSSPQLTHQPDEEAESGQLGTVDHSPPPKVAQYHSSQPFLSQQFGSSRSFHPPAMPTTTAAGLFKSLAVGRLRDPRQPTAAAIVGRPLGGPNAAYFGSLQRLMPYNLEYDFAAMRERMAVDESLEYDQRLQQYWGVATTEL